MIARLIAGKDWIRPTYNFRARGSVTPRSARKKGSIGPEVEKPEMDNSSPARTE
jgi:hypothetical protein